MARGACNCGAVAFEIGAPLTDVYICHCSICRRFSGTHGAAVVVVDNTVFKWTRGEDHISTWKKPDAHWHCFFCRTCGSALPGPDSDTRTYIPVGAISDGGENLRVAQHIFVGSKAPWDEIGDSGQQHDEHMRR